MNRWEAFTDMEVRRIEAAVHLTYSEGTGGSGDNESDRRLDHELLKECQRREIETYLDYFLSDGF